MAERHTINTPWIVNRALLVADSTRWRTAEEAAWARRVSERMDSRAFRKCVATVYLGAGGPYLSNAHSHEVGSRDNDALFTRALATVRAFMEVEVPRG